MNTVKGINGILKKSFKFAIFIAMGITIGGCLIPRLCFKSLYDSTWPPVLNHACIYYLTSFIISFSVYFLIEFLRSKKSSRKSENATK